MDNKSIFARTNKGEDEMHSRTSHLAGDVKRALLMVDGSATFGEISKRAAPSMRASLAEMFQELEKEGFIQAKSMVSKTSKVAAPPKMVVPAKMAIPKQPPVDEDAGELDFMSGFKASPPEAPTAASKAEKLRLAAEEKSNQEIEAQKIKAQREAEAILLKAEQEAAIIREETARRAKIEAENTLLKAEQEVRKVRDELEAARLKAEQETRLRLEAAARERQQAEAVRVKAEQEAAYAREAAKMLARQEREAAQAREVAGEQEAKTTEAVPAAKPDTFAFDSFHIEQPREATKTIQPADVRQPVKQQVAPSAASKIVDGQPSQEQIQRAMQERKAVDERMAAEALEAKKMAEAQAKVWAEAEQRAIEAARAEVEQVAKKVSFTVDDTPVAKSAPVARVRRKSFPWGKLVGFVFKLGLFLLVLLVGALFVIPYVVPLRDYMPKAEQLLSAKLHQPVHIGHLSGRILPLPRLELGEIYIGDAKQFQAENAQINFALIGLFTEAKPIGSVEFLGVKVRGAWLRNVSEWLQQMANENKYPVSRMVISQGTLDADAFELTGIEGELDFDSAGKFTQTNLRANGGKYALGLEATPDGKLQAAITVRDSALPLLPNWSFDELNAKGALSNDELLISDFNARILGGVVQGNTSINWRSGWRAQGELNAKSITIQRLNKLLDGNVVGKAHFKMTSINLAGLTDSVVLDGNFMVKDGMISGMDIVETARMRSKENLPGGRTHFDGLSGVVSYANNTYHFKQVKVTAGVLNATAAFDVSRQQLSGKMNVSLLLQDVSAPVDLQMGGTIDSPTLRYAP